MGAVTAYMLSLRGVRVTVLEAEEVAAGASGKAGVCVLASIAFAATDAWPAGGFLGRDWCDTGPHAAMGALARHGFPMFKKVRVVPPRTIACCSTLRVCVCVCSVGGCAA